MKRQLQQIFGIFRKVSAALATTTTTTTGLAAAAAAERSNRANDKNQRPFLYTFVLIKYKRPDGFKFVVT